MDDLKLYASNDNQLTTLINITKLFSDDINMSFGFGKCNKITIKNNKGIKQHQTLQIFRNQRKRPNIYERFKRN